MTLKGQDTGTHIATIWCLIFSFHFRVEVEFAVTRLRKRRCNTPERSPFPDVHPDVEVEKEREKSEVEDAVEEPRANTVAAAFEEEVEEEDADVARHIASEEGDLAVEDEGEAGGAEAYGGPEPVGVDEGVDEGGEEDGQDLKGLRELQPEEGSESGDGVVQEVVKRQPAPS